MEQHSKTNHPVPSRARRKKKRSLLPLLLLLLLLLAVAAWFLLRPAPEEESPIFAPNASVGALPGKTEEEIRAMLDQQISDKTVAFTVNANPVFETGRGEGTLMLESPGNNINYIEFVIRWDDTGETIYRSGLLKPNQYIEKDKLLVELEKGSYPCTVDITLYDPETFASKGMTQAGITITVKN